MFSDLLGWAPSLGLVIFLGVIIFGCHITAWICCGCMAKRLGRSFAGWFIWALFITPYVGMICLAALGETESKRKERILQEEEWKNKVTLKSYLNKE